MLAVYGNLIYDTIVTVDEICPGASHDCAIRTRVGGIANTCRAAADLLPVTAITAVGHDAIGRLATDELRKYGRVKYLTDPDRPTSQAVVLSGANIRTGLVEWGACRYFDGWKPLIAATWHHLMYLDRMTIPDISQFPYPVSADFCDSRNIANYLHLLPHLDYLIVAELEEGSLADLDLPVRRAVIVHSPSGSYVLKDGHKIKEARVAKEKGLNVVGAGDYFAAYCIANLALDNSIDLDRIHRQTLTLLRSQS